MVARAPCTDSGKKMKIAMVEQDIPQHQLARELGVATSTISDIIYGRNCSEKTRTRIVKALGIELRVDEVRPDPGSKLAVRAFSVFCNCTKSKNT